MALTTEWHKVLLGLLSSAIDTTFLPRQGELIHRIASCKEPYLPKYLYRYRRISTQELTNLRHGKIWLSSPNLYNDPYDCAAKVSEEGLVATLSQLQEIFGSTDPSTHAKLQIIIQRSLDAVRNQLRICSFCEDHRSLLMWAHYAQQHHGFCVEYNIGALPSMGPLRTRLYPVIYGTERYDLTEYVRGQLHSDLPTLPLAPVISALQKSPEWSYEREWRLIDFAKEDSQGHVFDAPVPTRIFIGTRTATLDKESLRSLGRTIGAEVHQMVIRKDSFFLDSFIVETP